MSNVALHMFDARTTENIFNEVSRVTKKEGLFLFHVNSTEDRPNRAKRHPQDFEIDTNFIQEKDGQTMRFFSKDDLNALLQDFEEVHLELIQIKHFETGEPFKSVWRGICLK